jgi:AmmeMemoRadiSam system protein A
MYTEQEQKILHQVARESIRTGLMKQHPLDIDLNDYPEHLRILRATFVTLNLNHQLRGCIGTLSPYRPLVEDIAHNAYAAAFSDPRFPALSKAEFPQLEYHISVLSETSAVEFSSEQDLLEQIRPHIDGLILQEDGMQGTFLPSVWEQLPDKKQFLAHLKQKAGLPANYWSDTLKIHRYTVESV